MQVLRDGGTHPRAEPTCHDDGCELRVGHGVGMKWLGRQDSNLGSRDQNPLPYRLATPHRIGTIMLAAVAEEDDERDEREDDQHGDRERREHEGERRHEHDRELRDGDDPGRPRGASGAGPAGRGRRRATTAAIATSTTTHQSISPDERRARPRRARSTSAILSRFSRRKRPNRSVPCSIVSGWPYATVRRGVNRTSWDGQPGAAGAASARRAAPHARGGGRGRRRRGRHR